MIPKNAPITHDFSAWEQIEELVRYENKLYILTKASEATAIDFRNANMRAVKYDGALGPGASGSVRMDGGAESQIILLSGCLFYCDETKDGYTIKRDKQGQRVRVPIQELRGWPSDIVKPLFDRAKEISGLEEKEPPKAKVDTSTNHEEPTSDNTDFALNLSEDQHPKVQPYTTPYSP